MVKPLEPNFSISDGKLARVTELVRECLPKESDATVEAFVCADWDEGLEHQHWLDAASADQIADWVIAGLK